MKVQDDDQVSSATLTQFNSKLKKSESDPTMRKSSMSKIMDMIYANSQCASIYF